MSVSCLAEAPLVMNYLGFPEGLSGFELLDKFTEHARSAGAVIHPEAIVAIDTNDKVAVDEDNGIHHYDEVVMAAGVRPRRFECEGIGIIPTHTCAICDGSLYGKEDNVAVIGGGDTAVNSALYLSGLVGKVYLIARRAQLRATNRKALHELENTVNAEIWLGRTVKSVSKATDEANSSGVRWRHNMYWLTMDNGDECGVSALFPCIGYDVNEIAVLGDGRIWKCGDCVERHRQVAVAVGSGANVALDIMEGV